MYTAVMDALSILSENTGFMSSVYGGNLESFVMIIGIIAILDVIAKGFALWRAARLNKMWWFVALLIVNSATILPIIFLLMTSTEYRKKFPKKA